MNNGIKFEVCCGCTEDAVNAAAGGADRIELNAALFLGGLTPSLGTLALVKRLTDVPVMAMVRPREGGFCYTETEYETMREDARLLLSAGADGLVFGFLNAGGTIDTERTEEFVALCGEKAAVFSRAVDVCPDIIAAARLLSSLGITRVLTSGGRSSAAEGAECIAEMLRAAGKMEILPGGGVKPENVGELVARTGVTQVHASARKLFFDTSVRNNPQIFFGGNIDGRCLPEDEYKITDPEAVRAMKAVLEKLVHEK